MKQTIKETNAYMRTIGKTLDENLKFICITRSNVVIGAQKITSIIIKMVARMNTDVQTAMVGRNKNIIQRVIN